jgi:pilus assembly protein CpaC
LTARRLRPSLAPASRLLALLAMLLTLLAAVPALAQTVSYDLATTSVMRINLPMSQAVTV